MKEKNKIKVVRILGIPVHGLSKEEILKIAEKIINSKSKKYFSITSGELMYNTRRVEFLPNYIRNAELSLSDSISVSIHGFFRGGIINRFTGPKLLIESCSFGVTKQWKHYFYGGAEGVAEQLSEKLTCKFPGLLTAGTYCPPFRDLSSIEEKTMIKKINESNADILWIGLGVVKQEKWINKYRDRVNIPLIVGVGGAFDYYAGTMPRCPNWISIIGIEWLYRLIKEPWRYKRIFSVFVFAIEALIESIFGKAPVLGNLFNAQIPGWKKNK